LITQVVGVVTRGTHSWIPIGSLHIQPSQLAVALTGLVVAEWAIQQKLSSLRATLVAAVLVFLPGLAILLEPDFGTAMIYFFSMGVVLWFGNIPLRYVLGVFAAGAFLSIFGWQLLKPYQKDRITGFLHASEISERTSSAVYHSQQSVIAVGSGGVFGRGLGEGIQSHLRFLPERQTDFVFASWAEETGLLGSLLVISLYSGLVTWLIWLANKTPNPVARIYCWTTAGMMTLQSFINIGMNVGLLPITGITLPLISYGGSSILSFCFHLGCVQSIALKLPLEPRTSIR
jgi:rod shape determining protein RodA